IGSYHCGFRVWAGYVGNFRTMDRHRGYNGFRAKQNGVVLGLNYDWGETASVGIYGGYSHTRTNARGSSGKVRTNAGHWGLGGRLSPIPMLRDLNLYLDAGMSYFDNDSSRDLSGSRATGSFDQTTVTAGLGVEYDIRLGCLTLTPNVKARYSHLWQDALHESGLTAVDTNKLRADNFHTALGVEAGYDFALGPVVLTPSAKAAWRHEFGDTRYSYNARYAGGDIGFRIGSARVDRDSLDIGAAIRAGINLGRTQLGVNLAYQAKLSNNASTHSIYAGVELGF
ncbi:MAG: autotransporter outer membrane beta-barrel domain-containing protein, partial [Planctomycetes bacterium]|nr:autotransporter outer membrane beta-barrel domain-containing protein [Planctomycetota bacterium]